MLLTKKRIVFFILVSLGVFIFLQKVFSGALILPQTFSLGFITIHYYGVVMALAVLSAYFLAIKRASLYKIKEKQAEDIMFWVVVGGFFGARIYHVLSSANFYFQNPADAIKVWQGGLSIYGAFFGGLAAIFIYKKLSTFNFQLSTILDWLTPSLILGQIIGRFGNLFNYEAFGYPTSLPWKMFVPEAFRPVEFVHERFFHPFFLYEILGNLLILLAILYLSKHRTRRPLQGSPSYVKGGEGELFFFYLLLYNVLRFALEFQRTDSVFIGGFRLNSIVSLFLILISIVCLLYFRTNAKVTKIS